jgi:zinc-binding in reverse transcriptase
LSHYRTYSPSENSESRNWSAVWTNLHNKQIPSHTRAHWYLMAHNKLPLREILYSQNRLFSPDCPECDQQESLHHKYVTCIYSRQLWARTQTYMTSKTGRVLQLRQLAQPELPNMTVAMRRTAMKIFAIFLNYMEKVLPQNRNVASLLHNFENEIYFCY